MLKASFSSLFRPANLLALIILAIAARLLWIHGEAIRIGDQFPLADADGRIAAIAALVVVFLLAIVVRQTLLRRANGRFVKAIVANEALVTIGADRPSDEMELIRERFESTFRILRKRTFRTPRGRRYFVQLPWYMVIGPSGSGKRTLIESSQLEIPVADDEHPALKGIGGTQGCDWWISTEGVLIDAGDLHAGAAASDPRAGWGGFLQLLKRHRRRKPVNGIVLVVGLADLVLSDVDARRQQAGTLRMRVRELHRAFGTSLPVYFVFTQCDRIAGFEEYFEEIADPAREEVWGFAFPQDKEQTGWGKAFEAGYLDIVARLERRLAMKLATERNTARRCRIYAFPHEFGSLAPLLRGFVAEILRSSRSEPQPIARGAYFASGVQEGETFDPLLGAMSQSFPVRRRRQGTIGAQAKPFFASQILRRVVFPEQDLTGRWKRPRRGMPAAVAAYAAAAAVVIGVGLYWYHGLQDSLARSARLEALSASLAQRIASTDPNASVAGLLPVLDQARSLREAAGEPSVSVSGKMLGIDATPALSSAAGAAYDSVLRTKLLPAVARQMTTRLGEEARTEGVDTAGLQRDLEDYLMLASGEHFDRRRVMQSLERTADAAFAANPEGRRRMEPHLTRLAELLPASGSPDEATLALVRARLEQAPRTTEIYGHMLHDAQAGDQLKAIDVAQTASPGIFQVAQGGSYAVPGYYTKAGFESFADRMPDYIRQATGTDWAIGGAAAEKSQELAEQVTALYVRDYVARWRAAMDSIHLADLKTLDDAATVLRGLSGAQSALLQLLTTLRENTTLDTHPPNTAFPQALLPAAKAIGASFQPLTSLVDPDTQQTLAPALELLGKLSGLVSAAASAQDPAASSYDLIADAQKNPSQDLFSQLQADAKSRPEPLQSMIFSIADGTRQLLASSAREHLDALWRDEVLPVCTSAISGRYPFDPSSDKDADLAVFAAVFGPNGKIESFFKQYLSPFVNVKGGQMRPVQGPGQALGFSTETLDQIERARMIDQAVFGSGGSPQAHFTIEPAYLDPKALKASFRLGGKQIVYRHGPSRGQDFSWPAADSDGAEITVTQLDGSIQTVQKKGTWAIFRILAASGFSDATGEDHFLFSVGKDDTRASFRLTADSADNPFNLGLYRTFRCPATL